MLSCRSGKNEELTTAASRTDNSGSTIRVQTPNAATLQAGYLQIAHALVAASSFHVNVVIKWLAKCRDPNQTFRTASMASAPRFAKPYVYDEACVGLALRPKKLFHTLASFAQLGCSTTNCHANEVKAHGSYSGLKARFICLLRLCSE